MKNRFLTGLTVLGFSVVLFSACSTLPQEEIDMANAAIEEAKVAGAELYAHDNYIVLQDSMNSIMVAIEQEKSGFIKNFGKSKENLSNVIQFAQEVKGQAEVRKEEVNEEINVVVLDVQTLLEGNRNLILEAPKGKEGTTALTAIKGELVTIEKSMEEVAALQMNGDYLVSLDKAKAAKEKASAIYTELTGVIAKYKANTRVK